MPAKEPKRAFSRISSEFDGIRHFDETGKEIVPNPLEQNVTQTIDRIKDLYDFETSGIDHWWFKNKSNIYYKIHTDVATVRSRTALGKYLKVLRKCLMHKYIWRNLK